MYKLFLPLILICFISCSKSGGEPPPNPPQPPSNTSFAKGGDISWVTEMEAAGRKFYTSAGVQDDPFKILKGLGMNTIRLRVWVNPSNGYNAKADVIAKALRAKALGMQILIDFHYSDSWADPGKQTTPAAWASQDLAALKTSVYNHTLDVLSGLKTSGIIPEWVQVGNETNDGMLWPTGKASSNMKNFAQLVNSGYDAVKANSTATKVIVHVSNGQDNVLSRWLFDGLKLNDAKWDVIGLSLYPSPANWQSYNTSCLSNINDLVARYGTEVMVVEVGMSWDQAATANAFLTDLITKVKSNSKGTGVIYWEPTSYNNWQGYTLGAFDNSGKPTIALNAFN